MSTLIDIIGKKYNYLTVISRHGTKFKDIYYNCLCDCGTYKIIRGFSVKSGETKSCGCYFRKIASKNMKKNRKSLNFKHGKYKKVEYQSWLNMKARCKGKTKKNNYLKRGITVCDEWINSFEQFYKDMGDRPSKYHSIDRIDNDKGYSKENCRWTTVEVQSRNKSSNRYITYNNQTMTLKDWANSIGIKQNTLNLRLKKWSLHDALTKSSMKKVKKINI
jgi:hypothetical protein